MACTANDRKYFTIIDHYLQMFVDVESVILKFIKRTTFKFLIHILFFCGKVEDRFFVNNLNSVKLHIGQYRQASMCIMTTTIELVRDKHHFVEKQAVQIGFHYRGK